MTEHNKHEHANVKYDVNSAVTVGSAGELGPHTVIAGTPEHTLLSRHTVAATSTHPASTQLGVLGPHTTPIVPGQQTTQHTSSNMTEEHHRRAAIALRQAADLHDKAARANVAGDHVLVAHYSHGAHGFVVQATEHANEAAKRHVEHRQD